MLQLASFIKISFPLLSLYPHPTPRPRTDKLILQDMNFTPGLGCCLLQLLEFQRYKVTFLYPRKHSHNSNFIQFGGEMISRQVSAKHVQVWETFKSSLIGHWLLSWGLTQQKRLNLNIKIKFTNIFITNNFLRCEGPCKLPNPVSSSHSSKVIERRKILKISLWYLYK